MDPTRRHLIASLALAPALPASWAGARAQGDESLPPTAKPALLLVASDGGAASRPPLNYGTGSPGPVLRLKRCIADRIILRNTMAMPTSLDLHGLPMSPLLGRAGPLGGAVVPGGFADMTVVPACAGTFWYHPWILDPNLDQTAQGLAGPLVVEETEPPEADADLVAILTDRWPPAEAEVRDAEALLIDGRTWPRSETARPGARIRLRLVNASTRRAVTMNCTGATPTVIAIDGQPSELFQPLGGSMPVGPGARFDLMFDMPAASGSTVRLLVGNGSGGVTDTAIVIATVGDPQPARGPIRPLPPNPLLPPAIPLERSTRATLVAQRRDSAKPGEPVVWMINGVSGRDLPKTPLFRAKRGTPVTLAFRNASPELVSFRVHGFAMRLLHDLDDGWEPYWRDSILVPPGATKHAAFQAGLPGHWLIESPFFSQAAGGFRTWFDIT